MGQALYRKYRSKKLSEIIGQEHITQALEQALKSGRISHAYLFTGPRGVGKTSVARILAHEINGLPYTDDSMHIDIIEIDAASNRRIDEIRDLRDKVYTTPSSAKYKVYIIDEVHMLTREAFNALLKTLEEPPAHVVFILATTDAHKLPATIISRTQRYVFKAADPAQVTEHLRTIAKAENIAIDDDALALLSEHGDGSFRDSVSLLDQSANQLQPITLEALQRLLGLPPAEAIIRLVTTLTGNPDLQAIVQQLAQLYNQGFSAAATAKQLATQLRQAVISGQPAVDIGQTLELLAQLLEVPIAHDPERYLEITLLASVSQSAQPIVAAQPAPDSPATVALPPAIKAKPAPLEPIPAPSEPLKTPAPEPTNTSKKALDTTKEITFVEDLWPQLLSALKQKYNTLYGVVRMAKPTFDDQEDSLELAFAFAFHQKRIADSKNRKIITDIIKELSGRSISLSCTLDKSLIGQPTLSADIQSAESNSIASITDIFGGGEVI